jgi:hypothetical protein
MKRGIEWMMVVALGWPLTALAEPVADADARKLLSRFDAEPTVNEVQQAALGYAQMQPELFESLRSRSRSSAAHPELRFRVTKDQSNEGRDVRLFDENARPVPRFVNQSATETDDDALELQGEVKWKLGDMVFNARETAVVRENRLVARERQRILQTVTQTYFERRRAQVDMLLAPPGDPAARTVAELKIAELTAELDGVTGGAFSRMVRER